jgi:large subunit ribosomal protein L5
MAGALIRKRGRKYNMAPLVRNQTIELIDKNYIMKEIYPKIMKKTGYANIMMMPRLVAVHISMGTGRKVDIKLAETALVSIAGQVPCKTRAKRSVAAYGIREGMVIGTKVTIREHLMYCFLQVLANVVLPSISAFRGLSVKSLVKKKNFFTISLGISDITLFPGANIPPAQQLGCGITITMKARCRDSAIMLLEHMGFPFRSNK